MKPYSRLAVATLAAATLAACTQMTPAGAAGDPNVNASPAAAAIAAPTTPAAPAADLSQAVAAQKASAADDSGLDAPLFYQLLVGELEARNGEPGTGFSLVLEAARQTDDERLYQRAADIALQAPLGRIGAARGAGLEGSAPGFARRQPLRAADPRRAATGWTKPWRR